MFISGKKHEYGSLRVGSTMDASSTQAGNPDTPEDEYKYNLIDATPY